MARQRASDAELAALGKFQGTIDRNSNFRQQAFDHNLGRNVRVVKLLAYLAKARQSGSPLVGTVTCVAAIRQNFSSSKEMTHMGLPMGPTEAAHFLPGQVKIGGEDIWKLATDSVARAQMEFLFAEVEHLPAPFNQADTAAEAKGLEGGLCAALAQACTTVIPRSNAHRQPAAERVAQPPHLARVPHPRSRAGMSFNWSSIGLVHPDSPAAMTSYGSAVGLPHPDSPLGQHVDFHAELRKRFENQAANAGKSHLQLVKVAFDTWQRGAVAGLQNALDSKEEKPGIPPLVGDRFTGYTEESIHARSTASQTLWNRDEALRILGYYLEDQREWSWNRVVDSCAGALRDIV
jgi:hypothetical protein